MATSQVAQAVLHDGWGELILSRPARKNALVGPMVADLQAGLATLLAGGAKAIVLRGAEGVFCSGLDVDAFAEDPAPAWRATWPQSWADWHKALYRCPAVIICAMENTPSTPAPPWPWRPTCWWRARPEPCWWARPPWACWPP